MTNNKIDISICVPSIRIQNWLKLYDSIRPSIGNKYNFELIFCGPKRNFELKKDNVHWIEDFGSPVRCQQLSCLAASGKYLMWAADDRGFY